MKINLKINGTLRLIEIEAHEVLHDVLRSCGFTSVRKACDTGNCGICTVLLDGKPVPSCSYLAVKAEGHEVTTIEGVEKEAEEIAKLITAEGAEQCGFCSPGFVLTVIAMKRELQNPTVDGMKNYLVGNLCRCSGYQGHLRAVKKFMGVD
ncbi:(2Fe-2S)-binding protein [Clostridium sp. BSD9I1]|uniref:(2Fe-2S)-binding protein n=1 Tax=Clostridium sp. BSD9I1 TaxID=2003589 RepID=UPI00164904EF|nr:2Fe-2S iron-sulfur cluster-binding protein [Clostridium sp. BSD9I1]